VMYALFGLLSIASASDSSAALRADLIRLEKGVVTADGDIRIVAGIHQVKAEVIRIDQGSDGRVHFYGEQLWWTPCTCERPPWAIRAAKGEGTFDEELTLRQATLEVCGAPLVPFPRIRLPLNPRSPRALLPEVGIGTYGSRVATPFWFPVGHRSGLIVAPEMRSETGFRQAVEGQGPLGAAKLAIGRETVSGQTRGAMVARGGVDDGRMRLAMDSRWVTDQNVSRDYGTSFNDRSSPYAEQLMVGVAGPIRLESNTFDRGSMQRPLGAVLSIAGKNMGPVAVNATSRMDWVELGGEGKHLERGGAGVSIDSGASVGIIEASMGVDGRAVQWTDGGPWTEGRVRSGLNIPVWGDLGRWIHLSELGMAASIARSEGALEDRLGWVEESPRWAYGPVFRSVLVGHSGIPLSTDVRLMHTPDGWDPLASVHGVQGAWSGRLQADSKIQATRVGYTDERSNLGVGGVHGVGILQSHGDASLFVGMGFRPGWAGLLDLRVRLFVCRCAGGMGPGSAVPRCNDADGPAAKAGEG
jgi:hypothetical protein